MKTTEDVRNRGPLSNSFQTIHQIMNLRGKLSFKTKIEFNLLTFHFREKTYFLNQSMPALKCLMSEQVTEGQHGKKIRQYASARSPRVLPGSAI